MHVCADLSDPVSALQQVWSLVALHVLPPLLEPLLLPDELPLLEPLLLPEELPLLDPLLLPLELPLELPVVPEELPLPEPLLELWPPLELPELPPLPLLLPELPLEQPALAVQLPLPDEPSSVASGVTPPPSSPP